MKVLRSTLVAAAAFFAAACGDKVEIVQPTTQNTPKVNSVTVSPASVVMNIGQSVTFTAIVDVSNGAATTVSWASSGAGVTVTAAGVATAASATPGVAICATSSADATKRGCAQAVVGAATQTVAPSISISAVNFTNGAGVQQPAPVPPAAIGTAVGVGPQLNVVMNVNAGTAVLDSVVLRVGGKTAYKQSFTAAQASVMLGESMTRLELEPANQLGTTITGSFNTADYCAPANANSVTCTAANAGVPTYLNGNQQFQALVFGKQSVSAGGAPANTQGQSPVSTYRFANLDGFHATMSFGNGVNLTPTAPASSDALVTANDQAGFSWKKGQPSISALFVAYTPGITALGSATSVASVLGTIGLGGCAAGGARTIALTNTSTTNTIGPWTGTWTLNTTTGATLPAVTVNGYEYLPAACPAAFAAGGDIAAFAAIGSDGNAIPLGGAAAGTPGAGVLNTFASSNNPDPALVFRLDNVAPPAPVINMQAFQASVAAGCPAGTGAALVDLGGRTNCWLNDAVVLNGLGRGTGNVWPAAWLAGGAQATQTSANGIVLGGVDAGSGRIIAGATTVMSTTFQARVGLSTDANATIDANAAVTSLAGLPDSPSNTTLALRLRSTDLMGNTRQTTAGTLGHDNTPPTLSLLAGFAHGTRNYCTPNSGVGVCLAGGGTNYNILPTDPSVLPAIGSGFFNLGATPLTVTQSVRNAASTLVWCPPVAPTAHVGLNGVYQTAATACATDTGGTGTTPFLTNLTYSDVHASVLDGYYTATNTIIDQAGNISAAFTLLSVQDGTDAAWGGLSYAPAIVAPGSTLNFSSTIGDNVDVQAVRLALGVGTNGAAAPAWGVAPFDAATGAAFAPTTAAGGATFWQFINGTDLMINPCPTPTPQPAATCTTAPTNLVTNTNVTYPVSNVFTNIQVSAAATGAGPYTNVLTNNLMNATGFAFNQGVNIGVTGLTAAMSSTVGISLGAVSPALGALNAGGGALTAGVNDPTKNGPVNWVMCAVSATGACASPLASPPATGVAPLAANFAVSRSAAGGVPNNVTITAVAQGLSATGAAPVPIFGNPFSSVQFYAYNPTAGLGTEGWRLIGTRTSANSTSDLLLPVPNGRNWYFTINWVPNLTTAPSNAVYRVMAVGITNNTHVAAQQGVAVATPIAFTTITITP